MRYEFMLLDRDWGCLLLSVCFRKIDLLPRVTVSDMTGAFLIDVGFLMLNLDLCILNEVQRQINREHRERKRRNL